MEIKGYHAVWKPGDESFKLLMTRQVLEHAAVEYRCANPLDGEESTLGRYASKFARIMPGEDIEEALREYYDSVKGMGFYDAVVKAFVGGYEGVNGRVNPVSSSKFLIIKQWAKRLFFIDSDKETKAINNLNRARAAYNSGLETRLREQREITFGPKGFHRPLG